MAITFKRLEDITRALKPLSQTGKSFHTTFIYRGNKLLTIGVNNYSKLHPHHKYGVYAPRYNDGLYVSGIHSEISAIVKLGLEDCSAYTFINIRINNNNSVAISKPCKNCYSVLRNQVGFKAIWYFDGNSYTKEKF